MKIVLADPPNIGIGKLQQCPNLGLLYLSSYVKKIMPGSTVYYLPERYTVRQHIKLIQEVQPDVYAISCTSYTALRCYDAIAAVKSAYPTLRIIVGGPHVSAVPGHVSEQSGADACVIGEGEVTFAELVQASPHFEDALGSIRGIAYKNGGTSHINSPRPFVEDIDEIPFPDWNLVRDTDFAGLPLSKGRPTTEMVVARGCPYRCVFCSNPVFRPEELARKTVSPNGYETPVPGKTVERAKVGLSLRMRSPESIAEEAHYLYSRGYREIYLHSDELNCNQEWAISVCDALAGLGHRDLFFQTNMRADEVSHELARALKKMNMWLVRLGIESGSQRVIQGQKKMVSLEQIENASEILASNGIKVFGYFMMFQIWQERGELQYETVEEVSRTLEFADELSRRKHLHYIGWAVATPVQGAEMYNILRQKGKLDDQFYPSERWDVSNRIPGVSERDFQHLLKQGLRLQGKLILRNGGIGWGNWRRILSKGMRAAVGTFAPRISDFSG